MFLEVVTVCVNYSDFLAETITQNRHQIDRWIIVTSPEDQATLDLCHERNLEVITTRDFHRGGDSFNKGRAVERPGHALAPRLALAHGRRHRPAS